MEDRRGVSPVVAISLLTAVTIIAASSITFVLNSFSPMAPSVNSEIHIRGATAGSTEFTIAHHGGEPIPNALNSVSWGDMEVRINGVPIDIGNLRVNGTKVTAGMKFNVDDVINYRMTGQEGSGTPEGSGTREDPYVIRSIEHIRNPDTMKSLFGTDFSNKHFVLGCDIDGHNMEIPSISKPGAGEQFYGSFDGKGHVIKNLVIKCGSSSGGLFGGLGNGAVIRDLGLENVSIVGGQSSGALVGANHGTVIRCYSTGNVSGTSSVGGLVGTNSSGGRISECFSRSKVTGTSHIGGLVGWNAGVIENCYSTGMVEGGGANSGGLVGKSQGGTVRNSFWDKETSGQNSSAGGTGKTTAEMKNFSTFTKPAESQGLVTPWDFTGDPPDDRGTRDIWAMMPKLNDGYPVLMNPGLIARLGLRPGDVITIIYRPANQILVQHIVT